MVDGRVFLRGVVSGDYELEMLRRDRRAAPRVRRPVVDNSTSRQEATVRWRVGPGDEPFLTQSLQVHFNLLPPGGSNSGHGHQNEAAFYVLRGFGHEIHDGRRYDWSEGDLIAVHSDCVHRHFNDSDQPALLMVVKAKALWMYLGLFQQGRPAEWAESSDYGDRQDWSRLWTPGVEARAKVMAYEDTNWRHTRDGTVRTIASKDTDDLRLFSIDLYEQKIQPGAASARHWHMADEIVYVLEGSGHSLHWDVEAEIADRYYARIATDPSRHELREGDVLYVPPNTPHQHVSDPNTQLRILCAHNRIFSTLGYDNVAYLDDGP
jgi:quercetin dioxygenase-like cupin family protein